MFIISVAGEFSSGKTTVAKMFARKLNCEIIEIGNLLRSFAESDDRATLQAEINKHGSDPDWLYKALAKELREKVDNLSKVGIISGIREPYLLCKLMGEYEVVNITINVNDFVRYKRAIERDGYMSLEAFRKASEKDMELGLDITMSMSDYSIDSFQSPGDIEKCVEQILLNSEHIPVYYKND